MTDAAAASSTPDPMVLCESQGAVTILTLNRPTRRNAMSVAMVAALQAELARIADDASVRAVILAHKGPVFSSGHDIKEMVGASEEAVQANFKKSSELMQSLHQLPKPVIAQISGLASAAGLQLAASCDLIVAADTATFQTPGVMIGLFCSTPMVPLSRAMPAKKVMEMLMTGQPVDAETAERWGLVNRVVPPARLRDESLALADDILQYSSHTLAVGKTAFYRQLHLPEHEAYQIACETMVRNALAESAQEGMSAFVSKRKPRFTT